MMAADDDAERELREVDGETRRQIRALSPARRALAERLLAEGESSGMAWLRAASATVPPKEAS